MPDDTQPSVLALEKARFAERITSGNDDCVTAIIEIV
jgi:hypothetical protein